MKKILLIMLLACIRINLYSQDTIQLNFDSKSKKIIENTEKLNMINGNYYYVRINGVNTSYISEKLNPKSYYLVSDIPDVLKTILPGISSSGDVKANFIALEGSPRNFKDFDTVFSVCNASFNRLRNLKKLSDDLYKSTIKDPTNTNQQTKSANSIIDSLIKHYNVKDIDELKRAINMDIKFIIVAQELISTKIEDMKSEEVGDANFYQLYSELTYLSENVKADNYIKYFSFIKESTEAKNYIETESILAEKDIIELNLTLVNNYKADTIYNSKMNFYTSHKFSFDFTTGFFLNNLVEKTYYLETRDTLTKTVKEEKKDKLDVSIGALAHGSYKFTNCFKGNINIGVAISPFDGKTRYLFGLGVILGRKQQFGISAGASLAKYKSISNSVKTDASTGDYYIPNSLTEVPTYDNLHWGYYVGVTYNLINKKKP